MNKIAALNRAKAIVGRVREKALEAAAQGKITFGILIEYDELNGVDIGELLGMIASEFEGTIKPCRELRQGDTYMGLEIIELPKPIESKEVNQAAVQTIGILKGEMRF